MGVQVVEVSVFFNVDQNLGEGGDGLDYPLGVSHQVQPKGLDVVMSPSESCGAELVETAPVHPHDRSQISKARKVKVLTVLTTRRRVLRYYHARKNEIVKLEGIVEDIYTEVKFNNVTAEVADAISINN